jgi:hypothetical protein
MSATAFAGRKRRGGFSFAKSFAVWDFVWGQWHSRATQPRSSCAMSIVPRSLLATAALVALTWSIPAHALSMHECSTKYRAAQSANTLSGMSWKEFRKAECGAGAAMAPSNTSTTKSAESTPPPATSMPDSTRPSATRRMFNSAPGSATFPNAVSQKYADKSAGKARMMTCLDQYRANTADNMNGGLKWIQKGGGYYSMCNNRLKEANAQNLAR